MKNKRLKIGIFVDIFYPMVDGVVIVVDNYAKRLCEFADVAVICPKLSKNHEEVIRPYKIVRCNSIDIPAFDYSLPIPKLDIEFHKLLKNLEFDIIHIHSPFTIGNLGVRFAKRRNIPVVATFHSQYKQDFYKVTKNDKITKLLLAAIMNVFNKCDLCYSVNRKIKDIYLDYGSAIETRVRNNGTDLIPFHNENALITLRKKYNIHKNERVLLFVGRIDSLKNIFFILEALQKLKEMNFSYKMLFIGTGKDEEELKEKIKKYHLENEILMLGKIMDREEISSYYALSDLFLFPSLYDASSLVQIEAASQKTPALFIEGAATADTVEADVNGYLSINNSLAYADKIVNIFSNPTKYERVCNNASQDLYKTWQEVVNTTYAEYLELVRNNKTNKR